MRSELSILLMLTCLPFTLLAQDDEEKFNFELEAGFVGQTYNDIQIPNDSSGTRFSLKNAVGAGPYNSLRFSATWRLTERQELGFVLAPFTIEESGQLITPTRYNEILFMPGEVNATYKFNTYRATYRYTFRDTDALNLKIGFTILIRDADVAIEQAGIRTNYDNLGFVPLLNFKLNYRIEDALNFIFDFNGLAGGPGRLLEGDMRLQYALTDKAYIATGFRVLEGGADVDSVYNFALLYTGYLSVGFNF